MRKICNLLVLSVSIFFLIAGLANAPDVMYSRDHVWTDADFAELTKAWRLLLFQLVRKLRSKNWKPYENYMSLGMQTLFRSDRFFKILPYQKLVVSPESPVPLLSRWFQALTEKYMK